MNNANVLPEVAIFLPTDRAGRAELVVDVVDVALQVRLEVAAVPALGALVILQLKLKFYLSFSSGLSN